MLTRRHFLAAPVTVASAAGAWQGPNAPRSLRRHAVRHPLAITMWDFSWLERRWPGAGYEDWDLALDELKKRGYDAVRIDAYPHLIHHGAGKIWELLPHWWFQDWGAASRCRVQVQPALNQFIRKCGDRGISVGLSTWFRRDIDDTRMRIREPRELGVVWKSALDSIAADGLLKHVFYVDLCNEFPLDVWAPFCPKGLKRASAEGVRWMKDPIDFLRPAYPSLDYTFSFTSEYETWAKQDVSMLDFLELHLWMTHYSDFYKRVGYAYERYDIKGYDNLQQHAERIYRENPRHWQARLLHGIDELTAWSRKSNLPLITTECWSLVDYRDWPMLPWDWLKDLCALGTTHAAKQERWLAIATSNFCGPQFHGMWRDVAWHRRLTDVIHAAKLPPAAS